MSFNLGQAMCEQAGEGDVTECLLRNVGETRRRYMCIGHCNKDIRE